MKSFYLSSFHPFIQAAVLSGVLLTTLPAADFGMEWLPLPEAYTWPASWQDAAEFKLEQVPVRGLPASIQVLLKQAAEGHALPATVEQCRADSNGDGEAEWILSVPPLSALGWEMAQASGVTSSICWLVDVGRRVHHLLFHDVQRQ